MGFSVETCDNYFKAAVNATGIVHPLPMLQAQAEKAMALLGRPSQIHLPDGLKLPTCEACVHWNGRSARVKRTSTLKIDGVWGLRGGRRVWISDPGRKFVDEIRIKWLIQLLQWVQPSPLNLSIFTADASWCVLPDGHQAVAVESGASPDGALAGSMLLPLERKLWEEQLEVRSASPKTAASTHTASS